MLNNRHLAQHHSDTHALGTSPDIHAMTRAGKREQIKSLAKSAAQVDVDSIFREQFDKHKDIVVYGAGNVGRVFTEFFMDSAEAEYTIKCFLDRAAGDGQSYLGFPVFKPDAQELNAEFRKNVVVVIAILFGEAQYHELVKSLKQLGYTRFVSAYLELGLAIPISGDVSSRRRLFTEEIDDITAAFDLMSDEHSEDVFAGSFKAHAMLQYDIGVLSDGMAQYVDVNVPFRHKYRSFVDCGAFTGDTLTELVARHNVENYIGFEPDTQNYAKLSSMADSLHGKFSSAVLLPLAVSDKNEFLKFSATGGGGSKIDQNGNVVIQTARLDDILKGYDGLMIKMDIEGAEIAALTGAKNIITKTAPDLAICVYHRVSDMWRIPLMLKKWVPDYRFYMRSHAACTIETVLYATILEE